MQITPDLVADAFDSVENLIVARYQRMLSRLSQRVDIDDLVQMVAEKSFRFSPGCKAETTEELQHWILTIAKNTALTLIRDNCECPGRSVRREECAIGVSRDGETDGYQPADIESDPSAVVQIAEQVRSVMAVLDKLPASRATAIRLRYLEQMSYCEVAKAMSVSNDAVRNLVSRGISQAKKLMVESIAH